MEIKMDQLLKTLDKLDKETQKKLWLNDESETLTFVHRLTGKALASSPRPSAPTGIFSRGGVGEDPDHDLLLSKEKRLNSK